MKPDTNQETKKERKGAGCQCGYPNFCPDNGLCPDFFQCMSSFCLDLKKGGRNPPTFKVESATTTNKQYTFSVNLPMEFHHNANEAAKNPSQNCEERQRYRRAPFWWIRKVE